MKQNPVHHQSGFRSGHDKISAAFKIGPTLEQPDEECNSHAWTANQVLLVFSFFSYFSFIQNIY
jgi:hypothetical protein